MPSRLISTAVGYNTRNGKFAALLHRLKFDDGSSLLTSWGIDGCSQLFHALTVLINAIECPENPVAEVEFKAREGTLTPDDIEAPGVKSIISEVWGTVEGSDLFLNIQFKKTGARKTIQIAHDDARSLMGYTANTLQHAGVLDDALTRGVHLLVPVLLFTCVYKVGSTEFFHRHFTDVPPARYRSLPFLYSVTIIDNTTPEKRQVLGGFFFKSAFTHDKSEFKIAIHETLKAIPEFQQLPTDKISYRFARIEVPDGCPLTEKEYLREFSTSFTMHSVAGRA